MNSHPDEIKWNGVDYVKKDFVNQEVEKRIAERMPSEEEIDDKSIKMFDSAAFRAGIKWLCSRLSQKTDNLKENNNNGSTN